MKFLIGDDINYQTLVDSLIDDKAIVLTRTWALAFNYIKEIDPEQLKIIKEIYNSYYATSTNIIEDIKEHNRIDWVKATRFIIELKIAMEYKNTENILSAFNAYSDVTKMKKDKQLTPSIILKLVEFIKEFTSNISNDATVASLISLFNESFDQQEELKTLFYEYYKRLDNDGQGFLTYTSEYDDEKRTNNLLSLIFDTANKLFTQVFCENSSYMTIHQAKGKEFDKVIVDLEPNKRINKINFLEMFCNHDTSTEDEKGEVTRLFFVACSRAVNELYIRIRGDNSDKVSIQGALNEYAAQNGIREAFYEFL